MGSLGGAQKTRLRWFSDFLQPGLGSVAQKTRAVSPTCSLNRCRSWSRAYDREPMVGRARRARRLLAARAGSTEALVAAARNDDEDAVVELIRRCERIIAAGLAAAGLRPSEAFYADAQNQALLMIWQEFGSFRGDGEPCPWMYRIARRSAASRTIDPEVRARRRVERAQAATRPSDLVVGAHDEALADRDLLSQVLARLDDDDREIIVLRVIQDLSTARVAEMLFLSESGVKSRLLRARKAAAAIARHLESAE